MDEIQNYSYFEHGADIGITGKGETLEKSFEAAAVAMFMIITDISKVNPVKRIKFNFIEPDIEFAFVLWLNNLLNESHLSNMMFSRFHVERDKDVWMCEAFGESWHSGLERGTEVKGATLTKLSVINENGIWIASCVVDV